MCFGGGGRTREVPVYIPQPVYSPPPPPPPPPPKRPEVTEGGRAQFEMAQRQRRAGILGTYKTSQRGVEDEDLGMGKKKKRKKTLLGVESGFG